MSSMQCIRWITALLLTSLVSVVNADLTLMEDITLKFLEQGHTFMSADSFHHGVEQSLTSS
jgi:hypothetical protein